MTSLQRCLAVLRGETPDRVPLFPLMMYFAADRLGIPYSRFSSDPAALAEAQLHLFSDYQVDAITACSDSYRISADLGGEVVIPDGDGVPYLAKPLVTCQTDLDRLDRRPDPTRRGSRMRQRVDSVAQMARNAPDALVMGWVEMPFAEVCEWFGLQETLYLLFDEPEMIHAALELAAAMEIDYASAQLEAGAQIIGCGDAAATLLSPALAAEFALPYEKRVIDGIHAAGGLAKLHICGDSRHILEPLAANGADLYNVDHMVDLAAARDVYTAAGRAFKGNVDPVADLLHATPAQAAAAARRCVELCRGTPFMLSCGCEIPKDTTDAAYFAFAAAVRED
ncbi:MAG: hypothetical protein HFF17_05060 [Oscillospiraceae bacterium]|nr:hypothetical protein [Oscillospiraceae bacterium]